MSDIKHSFFYSLPPSRNISVSSACAVLVIHINASHKWPLSGPIDRCVARRRNTFPPAWLAAHGNECGNLLVFWCGELRVNFKMQWDIHWALSRAEPARQWSHITCIQWFIEITHSQSVSFLSCWLCGVWTHYTDTKDREQREQKL